MFFNAFRANARRPLMKLALGTGMSIPLFAQWQMNRNAETAAAPNSLSKKEFTRLKCVASEQHTHDTKKITFALPEGSETASWSSTGAIANVLFRKDRYVKPAKADKVPCPCPQCQTEEEPPKKDDRVIRPYNPISTEANGSFTVLVKKYGENAKMGSIMHDMQPGDTIQAKGPNVQWQWEQGKYSKYGMVCGGTGITPLIQAAGHILRNDDASITMLCFNKSQGDMLLTSDLDALAKAYPGRFRVRQFVGEEVPYLTTYETGTKEASKPTKELLRQHLPAPEEGTMILQCGPGAMTAFVAGPKTKNWKQGEVGGLLKELGYEKRMVWKV